MTTIYIVTSGSGSDGDEGSIEGLFSTREKADLFINDDSSDHWKVKEWRLDEREDESVKTIWRCTIRLETGGIISGNSYPQVCGERYTESIPSSMYVHAYSSISLEHAHKLAMEERQEFLNALP